MLSVDSADAMPDKSAQLVVRTWNDTPISRRATDGYVNATAMCKANGKRWYEYIRSTRAKEYVTALDSSKSTAAQPERKFSASVIDTVVGGDDLSLQGTWIHPKLAVDLARWLSPEFAVWMDSFFLDAMENPGKAVESLLPRLNDEESAWLEARLNGKRTRSGMGDTFKVHGVQGFGYARCTNVIYRRTLGTDAKGLKESIAAKTSLPIKAINPRDHMTIKELTDLEFAERVATGQLQFHDAYGNREVERIVDAAADFTRKLLDGKIAIPGL